MAKIAERAPADSNIKYAKVAVPLQSLSNFWMTLEIHLINCETNLALTWSANRTFTIADKKLYVLLVTLSSRDNTKLKLGFKCSVNRNKYQSKNINASTKLLLRKSN